MKKYHDIIVIGGGQAGLSMSSLLKENGIDHVLFEKNRIADAWSNHRWDTFCLVTPNWQCNLPGYSYSGNDPYGFMVKDEIVDFLREYAASFHPPLKENTTVTRVVKDESTGFFDVSTSAGEYSAREVVVCTGNFHFASFPAMAKKFAAGIHQLHSDEYRNPAVIPPGDVLVVGTGQSGCQIAEDLHLAGRKVHLCVGNAPRTARLYRGKDVVEWLDNMGYYDLPIDEHPDGEAVRDKTNHYVTGRDGGREIDLRKFAIGGMQLYGSLRDVQGDILILQDNLRENLDGADRSSENIKKKIDKYISSKGIETPVETPYSPVWEPAAERTELNYRTANIGSVIWCIGYGYDFSWVESPVFNERGLPIHKRGVTKEKGLYFLGLTWQYTWGSARFSGVAKDAVYLLEQIKKEMGLTGGSLTARPEILVSGQ